jgi:hypothetical protein
LPLRIPSIAVIWHAAISGWEEDTKKLIAFFVSAVLDLLDHGKIHFDNIVRAFTKLI